MSDVLNPAFLTKQTHVRVLVGPRAGEEAEVKYWSLNTEYVVVFADGEEHKGFKREELAKLDRWIVIVYSDRQRYSVGRLFEATEVGNAGESVKDVQDRMAEYAGEHPELFYMVVRDSHYRQPYHDVVERWLGPRSA